MSEPCLCQNQSCSILWRACVFIGVSNELVAVKVRVKWSVVFRRSSGIIRKISVQLHKCQETRVRFSPWMPVLFLPPLLQNPPVFNLRSAHLPVWLIIIIISCPSWPKLITGGKKIRLKGREDGWLDIPQLIRFLFCYNFPSFMWRSCYAWCFFTAAVAFYHLFFFFFL